MIAIILAAGMGTRLRPLTKDKPKPLIKINGITLLELMIKNCISIGINKFIIVTGYFSEKIDCKCEELKKKYLIDVKLLKNEDYEITNTSVSTFLATEYIEENSLDDMILINGDNIIDPQIIKLLKGYDSSVMVIDNIKTLNEESFKIQIKNNKIVAIGKNLNIEESNGEFIGISKIIKEDISLFNNILKKIIVKNPQNYYDFTFQYLSEKSLINFTYTNGLMWTEIDDFNDYEKAKEIYYKLN